MANILKMIICLCTILIGYLHAFYRLFVPASRKNIKGKIILVTGSGRGIGRCLALQFADLGAIVVLLDINEFEVNDTARKICSRNGVAYAYKCDVSSCQDVKKTANKVRASVGHPDIIVNNAGIAILKEVLALSEEDIQKTMAINVMSNFWINKEFLPKMLEKNDGHIITMASMSGKTGTSYSSAYCASKFACIGLTESLSEEIRQIHNKSGVFTSVVCPMMVNTAPVRSLQQMFKFGTGFPIMEPEYVAAKIINGILRNKREIFIPASAASIDLFKAMTPHKVRETLLDFTGAGIREISKER